ncbi:SURF1 family protein [Roseomonas sp. M0104]|uniref:SURF1-like protein n=1 Tax=Teichococcus coralli TaxID=2545983 RepID=A0A845BBD5_9PROT|nr:SURF1 family cytochrome oxidase biogenesis protein [Pseudoroseomonas coralli]MXP63426.1 SURF1 family protein [Pseudoroseomonas coralli]
MKRWRRLVVPLLVTLPVLAILLGLGTWQVQRLHWKTDLLARLAAAQAGPAQPLTANPEPWTKVFATGRLLNDSEALIGLEVRNTVLGAHLLVPLRREDGPPLLVNRGWVPLERRTPIDHPEGEVRVEGYVRPGESADMFSATDDPAGRRFYTLDPAVIGPALGLPDVAPFVLVALAPPTLPPDALPQPARSFPQPPNNHLGYVVTWYGLALALVGVFATWAYRRLKEPEE